MRKKYYAFDVAGREAAVYIYGDITSLPYFENDVASYEAVKEITELDVDTINVFINSYGGEVAEALAIHNALKRHPAKIKTYCDGFACSAAADIFMSGDERYMYPASVLMIHNAWTFAMGNAEELRKAADDLDTISSISANTYKVGLNITDDELQELLDNETWITPEDALEMGFATAILQATVSQKASASFRQMIFNKVQQEDNALMILRFDGEKLHDDLAEVKQKLAEALGGKPDEEEPAPQQKRIFSYLSALAGQKEEE